jgi:hypothetical protein
MITGQDGIRERCNKACYSLRARPSSARPLLLENLLSTWGRALHAEHAIAAVKVTWAPGGPPSSL